MTLKPDLSRLARIVTPFAIILLGFALRMFQLNSQSFWADEAISAYSASVPVPQFFAGLPADQSAGYYYLLQNWIRFAGDVDFSIRVMSVVFGTMGVALVFVLGQRLFSTRVGIMASFLAAINPFAVYYSQEARPYSLVLATVPAALYWFARAYAQPGNRRLWAAHAVALAAALYSHYYAFALPITEGVWLIAERCGRTRAMLIRWFVSILGAGILYLPWMPLMVRVLIPRAWPGPIDPIIFPAQVWSNFLAGATMPDSVQTAIYLVAAIMLAIGIFATQTRWQGRLLVTLLFVPFVVVLAFLTARSNGIFPRYLIILLPAFILLLAAGLERAARFKWVPTAVGLGLCIGLSVISLQNYFFDVHYSRPDWRDATRWVFAQEEPGDVILFDGADPTIEFKRYYQGSLKPVVVPGMRADAPDARATARMSPLVRGAARAWLVLFNSTPGRAEEWLNAHGYQGDYQDFAGVYVFPYLFPNGLSPARAPARSRSDVPIQLLQYRVGVATAGEYVPIALTWRRDTGSMEGSLQASVRLVDAQDNVIVALDRAPRDGFHPTFTWNPGETVEDQYALLVPKDITAGDYTLRVLLYDPSNGAPHLDATLGAIPVGAPGPAK